MLFNCGVGEDSWEFLGLQGDPTSPSKGDQSWVFIGRTDAEAATPILWPPDAKSWFIWKDPDVEKIEGRKRRDDRGWDGWMASLTQWTWVWVNSWSWWWTGRPGVLQSMGSQRVGHDWATELDWSSSDGEEDDSDSLKLMMMAPGTVYNAWRDLFYLILKTIPCNRYCLIL